jgi:tetratricopeptide (TPR) repeat protein
MSLLLDALKKAAEQKAAKEESIVTQAVSTSDETVILDDTRTVIDNTVAFDEDRTEFQEDETVAFAKPGSSVSEDQTEVVDATELTQLEEATFTQTASTSDETIILDDTRTVIDNTVAIDEDRTEYQEDETVAFAKPDNSVSEDQTEVVDATELTQLEEDETEILDDDDVTEFLDDYDATHIVEQQASDGQNGSDSNKTVLDYEEDAALLELKQALASEKTIDNMGIIDAAYLARINKSGSDELTDDDVTEFMGEHILPTKAPVFNKSTEALDSDVTLEATVLEGNRKSDDAVESEDMSLTLMEMSEPTSLQTQGSDATATQITDSLITDSQITEAKVQILAQHNHSTEELNLVDIPEDDVSSIDTVTKRSVAFGGLTSEETLTLQDSTSTRTYAPDNYDRTLIKIDQDDASKLFAGMKSESDVLMTPDYAKKVFISNSSVHRFHDYKIYSGVAAVILLVILILGLFEFEEKSINIDNSLRALKRDPMPNLPKRSVVQEQTNLFAQTESVGVDTKTLALVENAGDSPDVAPQTIEVIADDAEVSGTINSGDATADAIEVEPNLAQKPAVAQNDAGDNDVVTAAKAEPITKTPARAIKRNGTQSLQLSSKNALTEKDELLKDAYAAYQRGDNNAALAKYNRVLADDPQNRNALLARAAINVQNDKSADAIEDYQTLLIANPKDSLAMSSLISVASISPSKSESQLKGMIRDEPSSPHLNFALANVYGAQNRWQEAQNLYFKALENNPNDPNYAYNLAVSLEHISKPKVAITYYQRALVNFNNGLATFNRAVVDQRVEILSQL